MKSIQDAATALSIWWAEKSFKTPFNKDNGDSNPLLFMLASMNTTNAQANVSDEKIKVFEDTLAKHIIEYREKYPASRVSLYCDYNPDHFLSLAAQQAELDNDAFPWKTGSYITPQNDVFVSFGYGKPYEMIY